MKKYVTFPTLFLVLFICGACGFAYKMPLMQYRQEEKPVTMAEFNKRISNKEKAVLVYFHADWCLVCRKMEPTMETLEKELAGKLDVFRLDTERDQEVTDAFEVDALPLLIFYKNGQKQWIHFGVLEKDALRSKIGSL